MDKTGYGLELLDFLETSPEARVLADGEHLFHQHDDGTDVFVVLDGTLAATIEGETIAT
jgi:CRP-like cAMP-binding protein